MAVYAVIVVDDAELVVMVAVVGYSQWNLARLLEERKPQSPKARHFCRGDAHTHVVWLTDRSYPLPLIVKTPMRP